MQQTQIKIIPTSGEIHAMILSMSTTPEYPDQAAPFVAVPGRNGLIPGQGWYAVIEGYAVSNPDRGTYQASDPDDRDGRLRYCAVIAWESYTDDSGEPALRAWLNGKPPVASDRWSESVSGYFINHYSDHKPDRAPGFDWS